MKLIVEKLFELEKYRIFFKLFKLQNSYLLLISDQEDLGIGNVTLGSPINIKGIKSSSTSYQLFGVQRKLLNKVITEKIASFLKSPVLLLLFLKMVENEEDIIHDLMISINNTLDNLKENNII
jgi:hypothetical protein